MQYFEETKYGRNETLLIIFPHSVKLLVNYFWDISRDWERVCKDWQLCVGTGGLPSFSL